MARDCRFSVSRVCQIILYLSIGIATGVLSLLLIHSHDIALALMLFSAVCILIPLYYLYRREKKIRDVVAEETLGVGGSPSPVWCTRTSENLSLPPSYLNVYLEADGELPPSYDAAMKAATLSRDDTSVRIAVQGESSDANRC